MNVFEPLRTYSSPRRVAVVLIRATSEPASGSLSPNEQRIGSSISGGSQVRFCSSLPAAITGPAPRPLQPSDVPMPEQPQFSSSATSAALEQVELGPAVLGRDVQVHQADRMRLRDHVGGMGHVDVVLGGLRPDLLLGEVVRQLAQRALLVGQGEGHALGHGPARQSTSLGLASFLD